MSESSAQVEALEREVAALKDELASVKAEMARLKSQTFAEVQGPTVSTPDLLQAMFVQAQETVRRYFEKILIDPTKATIEIEEQRYLLVRASALSIDFLQTICRLYHDRERQEALLIGKQLLFDIAHVIGREDAKNFHRKMGLTEPLSRLSAGPVYFAYTGWAYVEILPHSNPTLDEEYVVYYRHPFSFEADSWLRAGQRSEITVCSMNAGYSSGWCQESFDFPLTAVELTCKARGDEHCSFVMAPPHRIEAYLQEHGPDPSVRYEIPTFFARKQIEEEMAAARKKAEESDRAKSQFLATMSHELRTPLQGILGFVDLLLREDEGSPRRQQYLQIIKDSGQHLQRLLQDILDLSQVEAGQLLWHKEYSSLPRLLHSIQALAQGLLQGQPVTFELSMDPRLAEGLYTDVIRLQQVLTNLVANAIKYTARGKIQLRVRLLDPETLVFEVEDTGCGIPRELRDSIFEMFSQSRTRKGGAGLGLAIARSLIEHLGGEISVESTPGEGSLFRFTHPYLPGAPAASDEGPSPKPAPSFRGRRLLVVDDNAINRRLTSLLLAKTGITLDEAHDGKQAIERILSAPDAVDVILMDIQMPVMGGLEATRELRRLEAQHGWPRIPIAAFTAHAMLGEKEQCLEAGCDAFLTKPVTEGELLQVLQSLLATADELP